MPAFFPHEERPEIKIGRGTPFDTLIVIWKILDMMECGKYNGTCLAQSTTP